MGQPADYLYTPIREYLANSGKGFRPALCLATCGALGGDEDDALVSAVALEIIHNAFLVHDDIEDYSDLRRSRPTMHTQLGVPLAINAGDAMNAIAMSTLRHNCEPLGDQLSGLVVREFEHMLLRTLEGQALELGWIRDGRIDITARDYLGMVLKKTCWYSFIHPCRIGALIAQREDDDLARFDAFGYFLGVAFQIRDDVLNLDGVEEVYGKESAGDLYEGKRTLILIDAYRKSGARDKERLRQFLRLERSQRTTDDVDWVLGLIRRHESLDYCKEVAAAFAEACADEFGSVFGGRRDAPQVAFIREFVQYMIQRDL